MARRGATAAEVALLAATALAGCGGPATQIATPPYEIDAAFDRPPPDALDRGTPVRVSGVNVGTVTKIERTPGGAVVHMTIRSDLTKVHQDASIVVRPRIFLEGHLFIDLSPGRPSSPVLPTGARLPASRTRLYRGPLFRGG